MNADIITTESSKPISDLVLERDLQLACEGLLQYDGWRILHFEQNFSERKRKVVGEAGAPDTLAIRYDINGLMGKWLRWQDGYGDPTISHVVWIEWKRPKGIKSAAQKIWHRAERERGAVIWVAGEDFQTTYESFKDFYETSWLCRRKLR
jgi:hypothetical protein